MNIKKSTVYAWLTAILLSVSALGVFDIYLDLTAHLNAVHAIVEVMIILLSLAPAIYFLRRWLLMRRKALNAELQLQDYLEGLGRRIEQEFQQWNLTDAEKKTALYILKGMSHREIAAQCHRSEGTVRQHAVSVYRKAGLTSRAEFSAYFLQMLLAPLAQLIEDDGEVSESTGPQALAQDVRGIDGTAVVEPYKEDGQDALAREASA